MFWQDLYKTFKYAFTDHPVSKSHKKKAIGAGFTQFDPLTDIRSQGDSAGGSATSVRLRQSNEMVDLTTVLGRLHRYKEYERLRNMAEIDTAMTVFADEACLAGDTKVATPHGFRTLKELAESGEERYLVYCYNFQSRDYTLGWGYAARKTKTAETVQVVLDNGQSFICTPDHRILLRSGAWKEAGKLSSTDELMPFYRLSADQELTGSRFNQFPRIFSHHRGWIHERQFVEEFSGKKSNDELLSVNRYGRMIAQGLTLQEIKKLTGNDKHTIINRMRRQGFANAEFKKLGGLEDRRRVLSVLPHKTIDVYDMSVKEHANFATDWGIAHNCQEDDDGRVFKIETKNEAVKQELEFLFFHRKMLNMDQKTLFSMSKTLFTFGDFFYEICIDPENPSRGVTGLLPLQIDSVWPIVTNKGRLIEYQQGEKPDYDALDRTDVVEAKPGEIDNGKVIRYVPEQIVHIKIGDERRQFYPGGVSLIEPARSVAHQLRLMEDAMLVNRLTRAPERRVFYIDTANIPQSKVDGYMDRLKDTYKKRKVPRNLQPGASSVDERWHAMAADEDFWVQIRPNSNSRIETLPGAQNLGEIDDTIYFRNKLFTALCFPKNYFNNEDSQSTRIALSAQDVKFARLIERLQSHIEDAMWEVCDRHLRLRGVPEEAYEDLVVKMTPPSDWRELTRMEVVQARIGNATQIKGAQIMSDFDILNLWLKYDEDTCRKLIARNEFQKTEDMKRQVMMTNPELLGIGNPGEQEPEIGTEAGGPTTPLDAGMPPGGQPPQPGAAPPPGGPAPPPQGMRKYMDGDDDMAGGAAQPNTPPKSPTPNNISLLPEPTEEEIDRFDLDIVDFEKEMDEEEIDRSES